MRYALGVDGGGSKCEAIVVDEGGRFVRRGLGGPVHVYYDPPEVIAASFHDAISAALQEVRDGELWAAGHLPKPDRLAEAIGEAGHIVERVRADEIDTGYACAQVEWGLLTLSGTGSFVHGRTPDGRDLHFGGAGPILGDYGSAYAIGLSALRAAFASHWTEARRTSLAEVVPQVLDVDNLHRVFHLVYVEQINRRRIARLAQAVDAEAEQGDRVARACLLRAADEFADTAVDLVAELGMGELAFPIVPIGSVAQNSRLWWSRVLARLAAVAPQAYPQRPLVSPAAGAALLALRQMGVPWTPELIGRLQAATISGPPQQAAG
jgi:N-acetylglucosamine kinase-like BadF-type ATPase